MEKYEVVKDIGAGYIELGGLMRVKNSKELVAMKFIERGSKIDEDLVREIMKHKSLHHPNVIRFKESVVLQSCPSSKTRTAAYIPPEIFSCSEYDGKMADIWSCGVTLYVMLVGARPFEDENDHRNFGKTMQNIKDVQYKIPDDVHISQDCTHLLSLLFIVTPVERISIADIKKHPWFLKNLPFDLTETAQAAYFSKENQSFFVQTAEEIKKLVDDAKTTPPVSLHIRGFGWGENGIGAKR